jgi:hypothetical protein
VSDSAPIAERPICTNHPDAHEPCQQPATHRIIAADGSVRALACRIAERYLNEGERSEPIVPGTGQIRLAQQHQKKTSDESSIDVSPIIADLKRLRSLVPADQIDAHALIAQIVGRVAMLG